MQEFGAVILCISRFSKNLPLLDYVNLVTNQVRLFVNDTETTGFCKL